MRRFSTFPAGSEGEGSHNWQTGAVAGKLTVNKKSNNKNNLTNLSTKPQPLINTVNFS